MQLAPWPESTRVEISDATETITPAPRQQAPSDPDGPPAAWLLTCDHASPRLPPSWQWPAEDRWLVGSHWSYDLGAAALTRAMAIQLGMPAVLSRFTRLLIDPNRVADSETLFRFDAEDRSISLNAGLERDEPSAQAQAQRGLRQQYYDRYHARCDRHVAEHPDTRLFSVHSFTPSFAGQSRPMELAVLFNRYDDMAQCLAQALVERGWQVALNDPYSGYEGLIAGIERHGLTHDRPYLEIEVRQDIAIDIHARPKLVADLSASLAVVDRDFPRSGD